MDDVPTYETGYVSCPLINEKKEFEDILIKYIGWGRKFKVLYNIKKIARKTMIIELYRRLKRGN